MDGEGENNSPLKCQFYTFLKNYLWCFECGTV